MSRYYQNPYQNESLDCPSADDKTKAIKTMVTLVKKLTSRKDRLKSKHVDKYVYTGPAGIAYALWATASAMKKNSTVLGTSGLDQRQLLFDARDMLEPSLDFIASLPEQQIREKRSGFIIGVSGIYAVAAILYRDLGQTKESETFMNSFIRIAPHIEASGAGGSNELLVGRAGYLMGALWLRKQMGKEVVPLATLYSICNKMMTEGMEYSRRVRCQCPIMFEYHEKEYLGAAHGLCSILQMFLSVPGFYEQCSEGQREALHQSLDFFLKIQTPEGNFPSNMLDVLGLRKRPPERELIHFCHGATGVVYLMATANLKLGREDCKEAAIRSADLVWEKGLLKKGPGICHGVSGSGYVFLLLHRLTNNAKYIPRAHKFADFMANDATFQAESMWNPDRPYSLYEGIAGTICFYLDLLQPESAEYPFFCAFD